MNLQQPSVSEDIREVLSEVMDKLHDALVCVNTDGVVTSCNARFSQLLGTDVSELVGTSFERLVAPADREVWRLFCNLHQTAGQDSVRIIQLFGQSGDLLPVAIQGARLRPQGGATSGLVVIIRDLGEVFQTQQQAALLTQLLDHARFESILMFNKEGAITECNQTAEHFFGRSRELLIGSDVRDLFQKSDSSLFDFDGVVKFVEVSREVLANGAFNKPVSAEISVVRTVDVVERRHVGMLFVRDVSELKGLERLKNEFLNVASHELRTPLTIISGAAGNLNDGLLGPLQNTQKQVVSRIRDNCDRLGRLINDMLDLSGLASGKAQMRREPTHVGDVVRNAMKRLSHMVREKGIELDVDVAADIPRVFVDTDMIARVVSNLVTNAIRHTTSRIVISVEGGSIGMVHVAVVDNGPGLGTDDIAKLFDKFVQINRVYGGAGYKGTGLGLAICKHIIDAHEGNIGVESELGQGCRFYFSLPAYDEKKQLRTFLDESISAASAASTPMLLITILPTSPVGDDGVVYDLLNTLKQFLKDRTFRKTDTIFLLKDPLCLVMAVHGGRSKADAILQRINDTIHELKKKKSAKNLMFTFGLSVYPDDAQDPDDLFLSTLKSQVALPNRRKLWQLLRRTRRA